GITEAEPSAPSVSCWSPEPSGWTRHSCGLDRSLLVKAMHTVYRDNVAVVAPIDGETICRMSVPSGRATKRAVESALRTDAPKAICVPACDHDSELRPRSR